MILYKTVFKTAETEQIINRSRFITHVAPVNSYEEAQTFVAKIKEKYNHGDLDKLICYGSLTIGLEN